VLDTETTGLSPQQGHRIIEIGCVELMHRRLTGKTYHVYLQPDRPVDQGAIEVHGITNEFLEGKPRFHEIADAFKRFIVGAELIIHNAPFDVGFIEHEFKLLKDEGWSTLRDQCSILDTLKIARKKHPGQRNSLDALCKRYNIDNQHREKHGALLDSEILADVYLSMTGGQNTLSFNEVAPKQQKATDEMLVAPNNLPPKNVVVIKANTDELTAHEAFLATLNQQ